MNVLLACIKFGFERSRSAQRCITLFIGTKYVSFIASRQGSMFDLDGSRGKFMLKALSLSECYSLRPEGLLPSDWLFGLLKVSFASVCMRKGLEIYVCESGRNAKARLPDPADTHSDREEGCSRPSVAFAQGTVLLRLIRSRHAGLFTLYVLRTCTSRQCGNKESSRASDLYLCVRTVHE
jgi:hypothetical protein